MLLVCPRCSGSLPPDARACPRCGLVLTNVNQPAADDLTEPKPVNGRDPSFSTEESVIVAQTSPAPYVVQSEAQGSGTAPYVTPEQPSYQVPVRPRSREASPPAAVPIPETSANNASLLVPRGAVEMLPNESVVFQLGALYLTNKRVILLAPSVLRTAFLRDVDAVGTLTERASGWTVFFGLLLLAVAGASVYFSIDRAQYDSMFEPIRAVDPRIIAVVAALIAIYLFVNYFFWVKRTLFLSVGGRPLITVSITDWNARKLEGMDQFLNAFSQVKDATHTEETLP